MAEDCQLTAATSRKKTTPPQGLTLHVRITNNPDMWALITAIFMKFGDVAFELHCRCWPSFLRLRRTKT